MVRSTSAFVSVPFAYFSNAIRMSGAVAVSGSIVTHRKPMVGGYLSRVPKRLDDWMDRQPVIHAIREYSPSGLSQAEGRAALRDFGVRYVITREDSNVCVEHELNLPRVYEGEGVRIYDVPVG
jgi:hypothetical protein